MYRYGIEFPGNFRDLLITSGQVTLNMPRTNTPVSVCYVYYYTRLCLCRCVYVCLSVSVCVFLLASRDGFSCDPEESLFRPSPHMLQSQASHLHQSPPFMPHKTGWPTYSVYWTYLVGNESRVRHSARDTQFDTVCRVTTIALNSRSVGNGQEIIDHTPQCWTVEVRESLCATRD